MSVIYAVGYLYGVCCVYSVFETSLPCELPIVHEITTVLREWHHLWKELYLVCLNFFIISRVYLLDIYCSSFNIFSELYNSIRNNNVGLMNE